MAKKTRAELLAFYSTEEGLRKINVVRSNIQNNTITTFAEIFATIAPTNLQALLGKEYTAFSKHIQDPGRFTLNEIGLLANFFKIDFEIMYKFVRKGMVDGQKKNKKHKGK